MSDLLLALLVISGLGDLFCGAQAPRAAAARAEPTLCDVGEFLCHDHLTCISEDWLCDGEPDCPDSSDEALERCPEEVRVRCPLNHIQCIGTRKCIHFNKLCNGAKDCPDGFDEGVHCRGIAQSGAADLDRENAGTFHKLPQRQPSGSSVRAAGAVLDT
ncbi:low-density lipoprotein receptor-related protein 1B-like, partial [Denticeps clupeoides]|uniref:low-density lipoprotein receptor-related protein 1B-like n=1 Tax=Denticeps clupeoides TaxID=299321 RepID=UPI0010A4B635